MSTQFQQIRSIFLGALEQPMDEWSSYLEQAAAGDGELQAQVRILLDAHAEGTGLLDKVVQKQPGLTLDQPITEKPGTQIGPYKLLQQIGEGGMGVVYMAEQKEPVERRVALKIIKPGMDTRAVVARFEAERQALAMMDHPNIARVLDAGTTDARRPYFVMELVRGVPITQYCDDKQLTPRQRLELFVATCHAAQHAHQKGIIHRDIKPSNVLVAEYDDRPVPKVIDFGVAKAIDQRLTEKTVFTEFGQVVGTVEYMSPEQAKLNHLDIDTRTDVYSLGVLLYELLTGETPFDRERLRSAAFDELLRIIREEEPPRPSLRLSTSASLPVIAANRDVEPKKLSALVRGELDWIVMKALEKNRTRRYETAAALASDAENYLHDKPVQACPPSKVYMVGKFVRRNRTWLSAASAVLATVLVALASSTVLVARERDAARLAADREANAAEEADRQRQRAEENLRETRAAVDRLFTRAAEDLGNVPHMTKVRHALLEDAAEFYEGFVQQKSDDPEIRAEMASAYHRLGNAYWELARFEDAVGAMRSCATIRERLCEESPDSIDLKSKLMEAYGALGAWIGDATHHGSPASHQYKLKALEIAETLTEQRPKHLPTRLHYLLAHSCLYMDAQRSPKNEPHARRALELLDQLHADFPEYKALDIVDASTRLWIAVYFARTQNHDEADSQFRRCAELYADALQAHPNSWDIKGNCAHFDWYFAMFLKDRGQFAESVERYEHAVNLLVPLIDNFPGRRSHIRRLRDCYGGMTEAFIAMNRFEEASSTMLKLRQLPAIEDDEHPRNTKDLASHFYRSGLAYFHVGQEARAAEMFRHAIQGFNDVMQNADPESPVYAEAEIARGWMRWILVSCPLPQFRDPEQAIAWSKEGLQNDPLWSDGWNTLGIGQYRLGRIDDAIEALEKSAKLRNNSHVSDCYFLAMAHWKAGHHAVALNWYQRGVKQDEKNLDGVNLDSENFRLEAEKVMGIKSNTDDENSQPSNSQQEASANDAPDASTDK